MLGISFDAVMMRSSVFYASVRFCKKPQCITTGLSFGDMFQFVEFQIHTDEMQRDMNDLVLLASNKAGLFDEDKEMKREGKERWNKKHSELEKFKCRKRQWNGPFKPFIMDKKCALILKASSKDHSAFCCQPHETAPIACIMK